MVHIFSLRVFVALAKGLWFLKRRPLLTENNDRRRQHFSTRVGGIGVVAGSRRLHVIVNAYLGRASWRSGEPRWWGLFACVWLHCVWPPDDHCRSIYDLFFAWSPWMRSGWPVVQVDPQ